MNAAEGPTKKYAIRYHRGVLSVDHAVIAVTGRIREFYRVTDQNHFTYSMDLSHDEGRNWDPVSVEMTLTRVD